MVPTYVSTVIEWPEAVVGGLSINESVNTIVLELGTFVEKKLVRVRKLPFIELFDELLIKLLPLLTLMLNEPFDAGVYPENVSCNDPPEGMGLLLTKLKLTAL